MLRQATDAHQLSGLEPDKLAEVLILQQAVVDLLVERHLYLLALPLLVADYGFHVVLQHPHLLLVVLYLLLLVCGPFSVT